MVLQINRTEMRIAHFQLHVNFIYTHKKKRRENKYERWFKKFNDKYNEKERKKKIKPLRSSISAITEKQFPTGASIKIH